jgi:hypothetical protein
MTDATHFRILTPGSYNDLQPVTPFTITSQVTGLTGTFNSTAFGQTGGTFATTGAYGGLVSVTVTAGGSGYTNPISVTIATPTTVGIGGIGNVAATAVANTTGLDLAAPQVSGSASIAVNVLPSAIWDVSVNGYLAAKGSGNISLNSGSSPGSSFTLPGNVFNSLNSTSILTAGTGNISITANSVTSTVNIGPGNKIYASGTGSISIQGGSNPSSGFGSILSNGTTIETVSGDINFPVATSSLLLQNAISTSTNPGSLSAVSVPPSSGGSGYINGSTVTVLGGRLTAVSVTGGSGGSGYTNGETVTIKGIRARIMSMEPR